MQGVPPPPPPPGNYTGAIPSSLNYGIAPTHALKSARVVRNFIAENQGVFSATNNTARIQVVAEGFADLKKARLCFDLTSTSEAGFPIMLDGGAQCVLQRIRILSLTGNEIERIEGYNLIAPVLDQYMDTQWDMFDKSVCGGNPNGYEFKPTVFTAAGGTITLATNTLAGTTVRPTVADFNIAFNPSAANSTTVVRPAHDETITGANITGVTMNNPDFALDMDTCDLLNTGITRTYQIPLTAMGWFNPTLGKLLPPGIPFTLELSFATNTTALCSTVAPGAAVLPSYTIQNLLLKVPVVNIDDPAFRAAMGSLKSAGYEWTAQTYKLYTSSWPTCPAGTSQTVQISDRSRSLNALIGVLRNTDFLSNDIAVAARLKLCKRSIQAIADYQFTIGSDLYPPQPIYYKGNTVDGGTGTGGGANPVGPGTVALNLGDSWNEARKVFGPGGVITRSNFADSMLPGQNGTGVMCVDLQSYHSDRRMSSGIDTASTATPITLNLHTGYANVNHGTQLDMFARCDITFVLVPGTGELRSLL